MGWYINHTIDGTLLPTTGKADALLKDTAESEFHLGDYADVYGKTEAEGKCVICVVSNGVFEAAMFCFSRDEFEVALAPDARPRRWLIMDRALAEKLSSFDQTYKAKTAAVPDHSGG